MPADHVSGIRTDEDLAASALAGDDEAFASLVSRYAVPIYRFAYRFTSSPDDAEDIAQETFLRLYQNLPRLRLDAPLKPWIFHVAANLCRNLAARKKSVLFSELEDGEGESSFPDALQSEEENPHEQAVSEHARAEVRSALSRLPDKYRIVLSLYYFEHLSYEEIASFLSLPVNTVRTHLRRAKDRLALLLLPSPQ